jgi:hypothetical protein
MNIKPNTVLYHYSPEYREQQLQYHKQRNQKPEVKARRREYDRKYNKRPEVRKRNAEYQRIYIKTHPGARERQKERLRKYMKEHAKEFVKPRNEEIEMVIDVFTDFSVELTPTQVWKKVGGRYHEVDADLIAYYKAEVLKKERRGANVFYSLNPESPFCVIADGLFEKKVKEVEEKFSRVRI